MSSNKRKAIVFDLDEGRKAKCPRIKQNLIFSNNFENVECQQSNWVSYMQPEIFNLTFMMEVLEKCHLRSSNLTGKSKEELQKTFLQYATPKPQRLHRLNRLGRALSSLQRNKSSLYAHEWQKWVADADTKSSNNAEISKCKEVLSTISSGLASERLKPPVQSCINAERKIIKLSGTKSASLASSSFNETISLLKNAEERESKKSIGFPNRLNTVNLNSEKSQKQLKIDRNASPSKIHLPNKKDSSSPAKRAAVSWP